MSETNIYSAPTADLHADNETDEAESPKWMDFDGRLNRVRYATGFLCVSLITEFLTIAAIIYFGTMFQIAEMDKVFKDFEKFFAHPVTIALIVIGVGLMVFNLVLWFSFLIRRWHDLGKTGWLALLTLIPLAGVVVDIALCFLRGDPVSNRYGLRNPENTTGWIVALVILLIALAVAVVVEQLLPQLFFPASTTL